MVRHGVPAAIVILLCGGAFAANDQVVSQKGKMFGPAKIAIKAGETLRIANDDDIVHHVFINSDTVSFDSGHQAKGETAAIRFTRAGNYEVRCAIHPKMKLVVTVN